jgi:hypothetical protein
MATYGPTLIDSQGENPPDNVPAAGGDMVPPGVLINILGPTSGTITLTMIPTTVIDQNLTVTVGRVVNVASGAHAYVRIPQSQYSNASGLVALNWSGTLTGSTFECFT